MILGAASNEKQTAALRSIQPCADTAVLQNQDKPACAACGVVDKRGEQDRVRGAETRFSACNCSVFDRLMPWVAAFDAPHAQR